MVINMKTMANCCHFYNLMSFAQKRTLQIEMVVTVCCFFVHAKHSCRLKRNFEEGRTDKWNTKRYWTERHPVASFQVKVISLRTRNLCNRRSFVQLRREIDLRYWNEKTVKWSDPKPTELHAYREWLLGHDSVASIPQCYDVRGRRLLNQNQSTSYPRTSLFVRLFSGNKTKKEALLSSVLNKELAGGSVGWASGCRAGGREFDSGRTNTQGLKITEEKVLPL